MDWSLFPRGLLIGLSVAAPVGPLGVLCIRRTLAHGRHAGFVSGLGVASADAVYGGIAAFGLTSISTFLVGIQDWVRIVGGLFLCLIGWRTLRSVAASVGQESAAGQPLGAWRAYLSTLGLTLTNPMTILSFTAIFAGLGLAATDANGTAAALVLGVFAGSTLWWLVLSSGTGLLRGWLAGGRLTLVNRVSGVVILGFGLLALVSVVR